VKVWPKMRGTERGRVRQNGSEMCPRCPKWVKTHQWP
jgi:hypothetical protein